jgi:micrococcal nuclease
MQQLFSLENTVLTNCIVHDIYDGDSFTVSAQFPQIKKPCSFKCRLKGIDTPELRTKDTCEKKLATLAKNCVVDTIRSIGVQNVKCHQFGKYGRLIVDVTLNNGESLSEMLITRKLGVVYDGRSSRRRVKGFWARKLKKYYLKNNNDLKF